MILTVMDPGGLLLCSQNFVSQHHHILFT